jgi:peptidoglycan hydrolase CwlO-like protein
MGRVIITILVVGIIAGLIFYFYSSGYRTQLDQQNEQISQLNDQVQKLQSENEQLKAQLSKVQGEQTTLAAQNDELRKAIAQFKATGKMPELPPPPK